MSRALQSLAAAIALLAAGAAVAAQPARTGGDSLPARAFEVRYRSLSDAADLVSSVLSVDGTLTLKPQLKLLVVQDRAAVLEKVEGLLQSFDLPPRNVEVTLNLFLGTRRVEEGNGHTPPKRSVIELTPLQFTKWTSYESLGSRSVNGVEGGEVVTQLSEDYRVVLQVEFVDEKAGVVKFRSISLQQIQHTPEGVENVKNLYSAAGVLDLGKQHILGAAKDPGADRALFLTLLARPR